MAAHNERMDELERLRAEEPSSLDDLDLARISYIAQHSLVTGLREMGFAVSADHQKENDDLLAKMLNMALEMDAIERLNNDMSNVFNSQRAEWDAKYKEFTAVKFYDAEIWYPNNKRQTVQVIVEARNGSA